MSLWTQGVEGNLKASSFLSSPRTRKADNTVVNASSSQLIIVQNHLTAIIHVFAARSWHLVWMPTAWVLAGTLHAVTLRRDYGSPALLSDRPAQEINGSAVAPIAVTPRYSFSSHGRRAGFSIERAPTSSLSFWSKGDPQVRAERPSNLPILFAEHPSALSDGRWNPFPVFSTQFGHQLWSG